MPLPACSLCGDEPTMLIQGDAATGDQTFVGPGCLPGFMLTAAAELTKGQSPEWWDAYGSQLDVIVSSDRRPDKPPAAGRSRTRPKKQAPDGAEPAADAALAVSVQLDEPCPQCQSETATGGDDKLVCNGCGNVLAVVPATTA